MRIDFYTKGILTLIAAALVVLVVRSFQSPPVVSAQQGGPQHVIIDGLNAGSVFIPSRIDGLPIHEGGVVPFPGQPVVIKGIDLGIEHRFNEHSIPVYLVNGATGLPVVDRNPLHASR